MTRTWSTVLIAAVVTASIGACGRATRVVAPEDTAPEATSPALAVRRLEWAFAHRDVEMIAGLLTADMVFVTAGLDSAGNPSWVEKRRDWLLTALRALLLGVPGRYEPADVQLAFDRNLIVLPDPRPDTSPEHHRVIRTYMDLQVRDPATSSAQEVSGYLAFYVVRGDTATIPADQVARGAKRDSARWWFSRIVDETAEGAGAPGSSAHPTRRVTLASILEDYWLRSVP